MNLEEIRQRAEAATNAPLSHATEGGYEVIGFYHEGSWNNDLLCSENKQADAELFCHAREDILALVRCLDRTHADAVPH